MPAIDAAAAPRDEDDPFIDWHSDARGIMDSFANDMAYRAIAGTQVVLLRRALAALPESLPVAAVDECFRAHVDACAAASSDPGTVEVFVGFLLDRVMLRAVPTGGYALTSIGRGFLQHMEEHQLPERPL